MEYGYYHPTKGYWQVTGRPAQRYLDAYPEGTIEVSVRPSANHNYVDGAWVYEAPAPLPASAFTLSAYQFHAMIEEVGKVSEIQQAINSIADGTTRRIARNKLERAAEFHREDPLMLGISAQLGMTSDEVDTLWLLAKDF